MTNTKTVATSAVFFVVGVTAGYGVAYVLQKRRYEALIEKEILQVKEVYSDPKRKTGIFASPIDAADALISETDDSEIIVNPAFVPNNSDLVAGRSRISDILREEHYLLDAESYDGIDRTGEPEENEPADNEPTAYNLIERAAEKSPDEIIVIADKPISEYAEDVVKALESEDTASPTSIWDPENMERNAAKAAESMPDPDPDHPYIITYNEYFNDETNKTDKVSVIYYEEDDQVSDDAGQLVNSVDALIGLKNLESFGLGSQDKNVVYIRNEKMGIDIEVYRDKRSFQGTVLGVRPEKVRTPLRMRENDL